MIQPISSHPPQSGARSDPLRREGGQESDLFPSDAPAGFRSCRDIALCSWSVLARCERGATAGVPQPLRRLSCALLWSAVFTIWRRKPQGERWQPIVQRNGGQVASLLATMRKAI